MTFNSTFASDLKRINFISNTASQDKTTGASGSAIYVKSSMLSLRDAIVQGHLGLIPIQIDRGFHIQMQNVQLMNNLAKEKGQGVIYCQSCESLTLDKIEAFNNEMLYGGVFYFGDISKNVEITNSKFYDNRATISAGVIIGQNLYKDLKIANCIFRNNYARDAGALRLIQTSGTVMIIDTLFDSNSANTIGVMYSVLANQTIISNTEFTNNVAATDVGVMALTNQNETIIEKSKFLRNQANTKAVFQIDTKSNVTITESLFYANTASNSVSLGTVTDCGRFIVRNTQFKENKALIESQCLSIMQTKNATFD